jgi:hypothetical protein
MKALSGNLMVITYDVEADCEPEFNAWQDEDYIPAMLATAGFLSAERYSAVVGGPQYMTCFQLARPDLAHCSQAELALQTPRASEVGRRLQSKTAVYEQIFPAEGVIQGADWQGGNATTGGVLFNRFNVSQEHDAEFNAWYNQEHLPQLAAVKGSVSNRRFRAREGDRLYLARYDLLDPNVPSTEAWRAVVATPWTKKMSHVWRDAWRTLFVPLGAQRLSSAE